MTGWEWLKDADKIQKDIDKLKRGCNRKVIPITRAKYDSLKRKRKDTYYVITDEEQDDFMSNEEFKRLFPQYFFKRYEYKPTKEQQKQLDRFNQMITESQDEINKMIADFLIKKYRKEEQ